MRSRLRLFWVPLDLPAGREAWSGSANILFSGVEGILPFSSHACSLKGSLRIIHPKKRERTHP